MEYKIVIAHGESYRRVRIQVEEEVKELIKQGYQPQGGVSITNEKHGSNVWYTITQAMVKMR